VKLTVLPKESLVPGRWYVGRGRNANVALWDGEIFLTIADKGGEAVIKGEPYYEAAWGCFQPFLVVEEGHLTEPAALPKSKLTARRWYSGRGVTSNLARWDDGYFLLIGEESGQRFVKRQPYYEEESGFFQPFLLIDEGRMVEPFGKHGWEAHYGSVLEI
jgi:hypothetical protein